MAVPVVAASLSDVMSPQVSSASRAGIRGASLDARSLSVIRFLISVCLVFPTASAAPVSLTHQNFYSAVSQGEWFILFHLPTCGACKAMQPAWAELVERFESSDSTASTSLATVDVTHEQALVGRHGVEGYPTMLLVRSGSMIHYEGERTAGDIAAFIEDNRGKSLPLTMPGAPTMLEPLLQVSAQLLDFVTGAPAAALLMALGLFSLGVLFAHALPSAPQYITIRCPPGLKPGQRIEVGLKQRWWQRKERRLHVVAPAGIQAGQPFFVPLAPAPHAYVVGSLNVDTADASNITPGTEKPKSQ